MEWRKGNRCAFWKDCKLIHQLWKRVWQFLKNLTNDLVALLLSTESVMPFNHLILCPHPPTSCLQFPSIRVFSSELALHIRWSKYWSFSCSISPSNEYLRFISFRIDWFDLLAIHGIPKSLLQHQNLKASVPWHLAFFMVQLSHQFISSVQ